ncbi:CIC11C00000005011 [Sungouiella intermedia]|uniref:CIC11C00000005011 n=1 Tax=Sungouiella intermedia TaxID=45354 RepID=A0A1L0DCI9_9ASCO|nr:CIC11C00000005011 [[Candida] intermedia]
MALSHLSVLHAPEPYKNAEPCKNAADLMEQNCAGLAKLTLTIRSTNDLQQVFAKMSQLHLRELHLIIEEAVDDQHELMRLYQLIKLCNLLGLPLESFSITYHADNEDDLHNSVRLMAVVALLNQLNWNLCKSATLNLHINYLHDDPRLELIEELPVVLNIEGKRPSEEDVYADQVQLKMLELSFSYLKGII